VRERAAAGSRELAAGEPHEQAGFAGDFHDLRHIPVAARSTSAIRPRLPDGKPDFSGIWSGGGPLADLAAGLPEGEMVPCFPQSYRQIFLDGRSYPPDLSPTWYGHSVDRWQGDTLVVYTVGFNHKFWFDFRGHQHTERLHIIERYTLVNEIVINDPGAYSRPFTVTFTASLMPEGEILVYICQESENSVRHLHGPALRPTPETQPASSLLPLIRPGAIQGAS
jgi:hypothetical protein